MWSKAGYLAGMLYDCTGLRSWRKLTKGAKCGEISARRVRGRWRGKENFFFLLNLIALTSNAQLYIFSVPTSLPHYISSTLEFPSFSLNQNQFSAFPLPQYRMQMAAAAERHLCWQNGAKSFRSWYFDYTAKKFRAPHGIPPPPFLIFSRFHGCSVLCAKSVQPTFQPSVLTYRTVRKANWSDTFTFAPLKFYI